MKLLKPLLRLLPCLFFLLPLNYLRAQTPSTDINTYVLFALEELHFKGRNGGDLTRGVIEGGNVGVNSCLIPNTKNLTFGNPVTMPTNGTHAVGYDVRVEPGSDLWELYANFVQTAYDPAVLRNGPYHNYACPLIAPASLPALPPMSPGIADVFVPSNTSLALPPGNYADVRVQDDGTLTLSAGIYHFKSMSSGKDVKIFTNDGTEVRIAEDMRFNNDAYVGPSNLARFFVRSDNVSSNDATIPFSHQGEYHGQYYAPNGRINLGNHTDLFGRFWAGSMSSDFNVSVHYYAPPPCSISGPGPVCQASTDNMYSAPAGYSYSWNISGNGTIIGSTTGQTANVTAGASGSYTITVTLTDLYGSTSCSKTVSVQNCTTTCTITGDDAICEQSPNNIYTAPAGFTYLWSISGSGNIIGSLTDQTVSVTSTGPGSFTLTLVTTGLDGGATCNKTVTVNQCTPICSIIGPNQLCENTNDVEFSGPPGYTYSWSIAGNGTINGSTTNQSVLVNSTTSGSVVLTLTVTNMGISVTCSETIPVIICNAPCVCIQCNTDTVIVDQNVTINFNPVTPVITGDPDLLPYVTFDKSGGTTPDKWKAVFDLGARPLLVKSPALITVAQVNGYAPGIVIKTTCSVDVQKGAAIKVISANKHAGGILIVTNGNIVVKGQITDEVTGTIGLPGAVTASSKCGNIEIGGLVEVLGVDGGGNTVSLYACGDDVGCAQAGGDIIINGLVKSFAHAHGGDLTLNRPNIRVVSFNGKVTVNANSAEPLYDEFQNSGTLYDIYGGLLSWVRNNVNPGKVEVQAKGDILVNGHGTDPTGPVRKSWGAIAAIATSSDAPGGLVDVRSIEGNITGNDRAFDVSGRNRLSTNFARIRLWAKQNISLNRLGPNNNFNPVVNASSPSVGDKGGVNELRSYQGGITVGLNAIVSSAVPTGNGSLQGTNLLTACTAVTNNGTVTQPDANPGDDALSCANMEPPTMYNDCPSFSTKPVRGDGRPEIATGLEFINLKNYPNPFSNTTKIEYTLPVTGNAKLSVYDLNGRKLRVIVDGIMPAGVHTVDFSAQGMKPGVYYYKLEACGLSTVNKMLVK